MPIDLRQLLAYTLAGAGGQAGNLANMQMNRKREQENQKFGQQLSTAMAPQSFPSPTGPTDPAPTIGQTPPDPMAIAAMLARAPQGFDVSPVMSALNLQQRQQEYGTDLGLRRGAHEENIRQFNVSQKNQNQRAADTLAASNRGTPAHQDALNLGLQPGTKPYNDYISKRTLPEPNQININPPPSGYVADPKVPGGLMPIPGGPADPNRPGSGVGRLTEDQAKNQQLYTRTTQQLPILLKNFDALSSPTSQASSAVHPSLASGPYQQAYNALTDIAASYLYSVSGATATPSEVERLIQTVVPKVGEARESVEDKKARVQEMVESIRLRAGGANTNVQPQSRSSGGGPKAGDVEDGYRFKGGNPSDPASWERVN